MDTKILNLTQKNTHGHEWAQINQLIACVCLCLVNMDFQPISVFNNFFQVRPMAESYDCRWCDRSFSKPYNLLIHEVIYYPMQNLKITIIFPRGATHLPFTTAIFVEKDFAARRTWSATSKLNMSKIQSTEVFFSRLMHSPPAPPKKMAGIVTECAVH